MTDQVRDQQFDVLFTGKQYLCIPDPAVVTAPLVKFPRQRRPESEVEGDSATLLACFCENRPYSRGELRYRSGLVDARLNAAFQTLRRAGTLKRIGYGLWRWMR